MLSIAIATMNRWPFLKDTLPVFLSHPIVAEVIVCDETGDDIQAIQGSLQDPKLRLVKNEKRLGIYENKRKAFSLATSPYVAILDSDNYFSEEWLDTIGEMLKGDTIYASADFKNADTVGNVTYPCKDFSGLRLNAGNWNSMFNKPRWNFLVNDGNWVVPKAALKCLPETTKSEDLLAADAIYMLKCFVKGGYSVYYVPDLTYIHTVHEGSSWLQTEKDSMRILNRTNWLI